MTHPITLPAIALIAALAFTSTPAWSGEEIHTASKDGAIEAPLEVPSWQVLLRSSYTTGSESKFDGRDSQTDSDAFAVDLSIGRKIKLSDSWALLLDLGSQNIYLDGASEVPIPDEIHTLRLTIGLDYQRSETLSYRAFFTPSLYRLEDISSEDIGYGGGLLMTWRYSPALTLTFGVIASANSSITPVLPVGGFDWKISDKWNLQVTYPRPRLVYQITEGWSVFAGGELTGATFRTTQEFDRKSGLQGYNNEVADYRDIRAGVGTTIQLNRGIRLEVEGGYSVNRQIDYVDIDRKVKFEPSPYVSVGLRAFF